MKQTVIVMILFITSLMALECQSGSRIPYERGHTGLKQHSLISVVKTGPAAPLQVSALILRATDYTKADRKGDRGSIGFDGEKADLGRVGSLRLTVARGDPVNVNGNEEENGREDENDKSDDNGGFDRLWDVILYG